MQWHRLGNAINKGVALLLVRCGQGRENRPGGCPGFRFVATGNLATNHRWPQLSLGPIVGGLNVGVIEKGEQMVALFGEPVSQFARAGRHAERSAHRIASMSTITSTA